MPVLRYSPYSRAITQVIQSGELGQLVNAQHIEPIGNWHFAHSYVRGNWSKESESSFSLMTKSCQYVRAGLRIKIPKTDQFLCLRSDIDILCHWFSPDTPVRVSSFGGLQHFRKAGKPLEAGNATRCLDCSYERQCPYSAKKSEFSPDLAPCFDHGKGGIQPFVSLSGPPCLGSHWLAN